jgi:predicted SnoaL-like aldol condensation-catalyzing enzyme
LITNILSRGAEEADIYMVSTYEWHHPDVEEGSDEHEMLTDYYWKMSSETVKHTVDIAKQLSREGKIANL